MVSSAAANHSGNPSAVTRIVGVGASAGGLVALEQFLERVPPRSGLAYIVVQHLDPNHESALPELLAAKTRMPVLQVKEGMRVEPDHVYVIPPNCKMTIAEWVLRQEA